MPARCQPASATALRRAVVHARARRLSSARRGVRACLERAADDAVAHLAAAGVLFVTRDYDEALDALDRALALDPRLLRRVVDDHFRYAGSLGWDQEVRESLERAMALQPDEPRWPVLAMRLFLRADAPERALEMAERALALAPGSARLRMEVAHVLADDGRFADAVEAAEEALAAAPADDRLSFRLGAAAAFAEAGAFDRARRELGRALAQDPSLGEVHHELAELALAARDPDAARRHADAAERAGAASGVSARIRGAAAMLEGRTDDAIPLFDRALAADEDDYVAAIWRAEAALWRRDAPTVHRLLSRATMRAPGLSVAARMLRFLVVAADDDDDDDEVGAHRTEEFREALLEIVPESRGALERGARAPLVAHLHTALRRMAGNRTVRATYVDDDGVLRRLRARTGVRHAARRALQLIRTFPPDETLRALDAVCARYPEASLPICHRGELHLWLGDLEAARRDLYGAIERHRWTRWAYIGLTGVEILKGRPGNALLASARGVEVMGGTTGPAVYVYRGEAHRRLGQLERARADLERAIELTPTRVGAWVNLALVHDARGDPEAFAEVWTHLERTASGLLSSAAAALGVTLFRDPGDEPTQAERRAVLEQALRLMRGNRSTSCATFFSPDGRLRFVQPFSAQQVAPHARDEEVLARVERALRLGVAVSPPASRSRR